MVNAEELRARRRVAFGQALRQARTNRGLTQEAVALKAGLDRSFYVEVETAVHSVTLDRVFAITDAIGISLGDLLTDEVFKPQPGV